MTASHETISEEKIAKPLEISAAPTFTALASGSGVEIVAADCSANSPVAGNPFLFDSLSGRSVPHLALDYFSTLSATAMRRATHRSMGLEDDYSSFGPAGYKKDLRDSCFGDRTN